MPEVTKRSFKVHFPDPEEEKRIVNELRIQARDLYVKEKGLISWRSMSRRVSAPVGMIKQWAKEDDWKSLIERPDDDRGIPPRWTLEDLQEDCGLNDQEVEFCLHYVKLYNWTQAYLRVYGSEPDTKQKYQISKLREDPRIQKYVREVQSLSNERVFLDPERIKEELMAIAFGDIGEIAKFSREGLTLVPSNRVDTRIIQEISEGKAGVKVKVYDKMNALMKLLDFTDTDITSSRKMERERMKLAREKFEFEKELAEGGSTEYPDDGFLNAIEIAASSGLFDEDGEFGEDDGSED